MAIPAVAASTAVALFVVYPLLIIFPRQRRKTSSSPHVEIDFETRLADQQIADNPNGKR